MLSCRELGGRGIDIENNRLSAQTPACLFNSFNFDFARLRRFARSDAVMVHRVDGPIGVYRGFDDGTDGRIAALNGSLAHATVLQSRYSLEKHRRARARAAQSGGDPERRRPGDLPSPERREPLDGRKVRLVAASWSDNRRKGAETLEWLDRNLDGTRYELTFVGRAPTRFEQTRVVGPVGSEGVAELFRSHDLYVAPSRDDPCSNALLEALACGLPAAFLESGGHPELVGEGGLPFRTDEELPDVLDRLVEEIEMRRAAISTPAISDVADRYLGRVVRPPLRKIASCDGEPPPTQPKNAASFRVARASSTERPSRARTTSSTPRTPGRRRRGSGARR